ncbi:hypothetical protein CFT9_19555 [Pseudomonas sp. CFT9]|jgi:hypothetical protein|nr:hypothetical protein CFT9_19555 [Pseudomonas sp. CFT9]
MELGAVRYRSIDFVVGFKVPAVDLEPSIQKR